MFTFQFSILWLVKVKVTKRSKTYFGHSTLSFHPIHMKPKPKCSLFNSLSSDRSKVKVIKRSKTYFGHNTLSFCLIHMKPTPKCSLFNSFSFDRSKVKFKVKKRFKTYFGHNTLSFRPIHVKPVPKCSLFNSLSPDRSRSLKGQKHILVITRSVFVRFIWNQHQNFHFAIPYPLIWWQMRRWRRYALYQGQLDQVKGKGAQGGQKTPWKLKYIQFRWNLNHIYYITHKKYFQNFSSFC